MRRLVIRVAQAADSEVVWRIHTEAIRSIKEPYPRDYLESWARKHRPHEYAECIAAQRLYIAELDGEAVGFGQFDPGAGVVQRIYVSPSASGNGVGRALLLEAERRAVAACRPKLYLSSSLNAVAFYQRCGFVHGTPNDVGSVPRDPDGVLMVKNLS